MDDKLNRVALALLALLAEDARKGVCATPSQGVTQSSPCSQLVGERTVFPKRSATGRAGAGHPDSARRSSRLRRSSALLGSADAAVTAEVM